MLPSETMIWQPEFTDKTLSRKPGAVHIGEYYVPWQEFVNSVGKPFRQYAQNMAQIRFRIDTVQTAGADQPVQQCTTLAAVIATEEHVIFLSETDCTKRSFRCVIVRLRQTVITEVAQRNPVLPDIPERISQTSFFR